jgi:sugar O-acyltransferase (sialic acid O-acetyltransferase NeuD family)
MEGIIILGAAGLAKEFFFYIKRAKPSIKDFIFVNDLDDNQYSLNIEGISYPVIKDWKFEKKYQFIIAVGNPKIKKLLVEKALTAGLSPSETIIDPNALVLTNLKNIGQGGIIAPGCIVTTNIKLGNYVTLNLNTTVGHDTVIGEYCTTNPGVHISGECIIGDMNEFGTGCIVRDRLKIDSNKKLGAQTAVVKDILGNENETFIGIPARLLNNLK